jgi:hypothetical protein
MVRCPLKDIYQELLYQDMLPWISATYLIRIRLSTARRACARRHFPCKTLLPYLLPLNLLDYNTWGMLLVKDNAMAHPDVGSMK